MVSKARVVACAVIYLATVAGSWQAVTLIGAECPKEICNTAKKCNDILNFCSPEQEGQECNGCDGSASIRLCSKTVQERKCTKKTTATSCGNKFTGTCTKDSVFGYFYCKKTAAGGSHSCDRTECTGDAACTGS